MRYRPMRWRLRSGLAAATATWRSHAQRLAGVRPECRFGWQRRRLALTQDQVDAALTIAPALDSVRCNLATLTQQTYVRIREQLDIATDTVAASVCAAAPTGAPQAVVRDTYRIRVLERFDGRVQCVAHVYVHTREPITTRRGPHAAAHGLVIRERTSCPRIHAAQREVVHGSLRIREHDMWQSR